MTYCSKKKSSWGSAEVSVSRRYDPPNASNTSESSRESVASGIPPESAASDDISERYAALSRSHVAPKPGTRVTSDMNPCAS